MPHNWTVNGVVVPENLITYAPGATATVSGRVSVSLWKKINPIWWFGNQDEPVPPAWEMPGWPTWVRYVFWYSRNPLTNFASYVIGVVDKNYTVTGTSPVCANVLNDLLPPQIGWHRSVIWLWGWCPLPYISYSGKRILFYAGWQPAGFFGFMFKKTPS